jgi:hypothetical protein
MGHPELYFGFPAGAGKSVRTTRFGPSRVILRKTNRFIFSYLQKLLWWFYGLWIGCWTNLRRL